MSHQLFARKEHSKLYQKYMIREPEEVPRMILSYLEQKKGKPFELAVDVGCGTGQSTRILAPHFQKVVGVDISESQIQEAKKATSELNVSYLVAAAEQLPFEDGSVDLITASVAAQFFNMEKFLSKVDRVLRPNGCLALYCMHVYFSLHYKDCSESLTDTFMEGFNFLVRDYGGLIPDVIARMLSDYQEIFDAIWYTDKKRVTNISVTRTISISALMGFLKSLCLFQMFWLANAEAAEDFLTRLQDGLLNIMGETSPESELKIFSKYHCTLACKPA